MMKIRAAAITIMILALLATVMTGCKGASKGNTAYYDSDGLYESTRTMSDTDYEFRSKTSAEFEKKSQTSDDSTGGSDAGSSESRPVLDSRKIIKTGSVSIEVESLTETEKEITRQVEALGGYLSGSTVYTSSATITAKIPADRFDEFIAKTEGLGKIQHKTVSAQDVTKEYFDLETRLENKEIRLERLQAYMRDAKNTKDMLAIERELSQVTEEIELLRGSFKELSHKITFSTLTISLSLPAAESFSMNLPSFKNGFLKLGNAILSFLYSLLFIILYVVIFVILFLPLLALFIIVAALLYALTFGRIGLVKNLFIKLSKKQ
jgi:hypothetical protein